MAAPADIAQSIACLGQVFPKYVQQQIGKLTDELTATLQTLPSAFGQVGDLNLGKLTDASDLVGQVMDLAGAELASLVPGALAAPSGNRIQDVLNLSASVAGSALLTLALVPETPFALAQRMCETLTEVLRLELETLGALGQHIIQLSNVMTVLVHLRPLVSAGIAADLGTADGELLTAINELSASRRSRGGALVFDTAAFDRGTAALERALRVLTPKLDGDGVLGVARAIAGAALPPELATPSNARLALATIAPLVSTIRNEVAALQAQVGAVGYYVAQLKTVVTNYRATPAAQGVVALRLQTVSALLAKVQDLEQGIRAARAKDPAHAAAHQLASWAVGLRAVLALAASIRADQLVEGAIDAAVSASLKATYGGLITAITAIHSAHVHEGTDDVTDLVGSCLGICTQAELLVRRLGDVSTADSDLRTFQVLVATTALQTDSRIAESVAAAGKLELACAPFLLLSIAARPSIDKLLSALTDLGLDRGRDLLATGQFGTFFGASIDTLSYTGSAIACLTEALGGIDDAVLRRQVSAIRDDLIGKQTNELLSAADTVDQAGHRRTAAIQGELAMLQANAQTVAGIVDYLKQLAGSLSLDLSALAVPGPAHYAGDTNFLAAQGK